MLSKRIDYHKIIVSITVFFFLCVLLNPTPANAINPTGLTSFLDKTALWSGLSEEQQTIFSQTDNIFYDPTECDNQNSDGGVSVDLSNLPKETIKKLEEAKVKEKAEKNLKAYKAGADAEGIPWQMLAAIHYREGGMDPNKSIADGEPLGTGTSVDGQKIGNTLEEDAKIAAKKLVGIAKEVYKVDIKKDKSVDAIANAFLAYNRGYMYKSANEPYDKSPYVMNWIDEKHKNMKWIHADSYYNGKKLNSVEGSTDANVGALAVYAYLGGNASSGTSSSSSSSSTGASASGSNIIADTAKELAWPSKGHSMTDPKPEYKKVLEETKVTAGTQCSPSALGADCGGFVGAVIYKSNYDKDFPSVGANTQLEHMAKHPELYKELKNWKKEDLKSGDIQAHSGHIRIVMNDGEKLAHASQCERTGEITDYYEGAAFRTFRPIAATSTSDDECTTNDTGNNDINKTAVNIAYQDYKNRSWEKQVPAFYDAFKATGLYEQSLKSNNKSIKEHGRSCSWWVATVVEYALGIKDFAKGPGGQIDYMAKHSDIFEEVTEGYDKSKAQAGDIQCYGQKGSYKGNGHSRIIVDKGDGKLRIAEAHLSSHMPGQIHNEEYNGSIKAPSSSATPTYRVFRVKGTVSSATSAGSSTTNLSGASSIGQTALELAWPTNKRTMKPTEEYKKALEQTGIGKHSDTCGRAGASCDKFVGITVRYSGVDKKFGYWVGDRSKTDERYITTHMKKHPEQWQEVTSGYNKNNAQDGDILVCDGHGCSGHVLILAKRNGKLMQVEGSYCHGNTSCCTVGRVTHEFHKLSNGYHAWRAKNDPGYNPNCVCQVGEQNQNAGIADGGYSSKEEADKAIMEPYRKMGSGVTKYGVVDAGCRGGITSNCSAFTTYFVNRYFDAGATQRNGNMMAKELINRGWKDGGHTPAVYAVFSQNAGACGLNTNNHTGIVLGINQSKDEILIGEAGCRASASWTGVHSYSLKCFSKAPFTYAHPPRAPKGI